jgi:cellulose biosynthesis protein BcsQ
MQTRTEGAEMARHIAVFNNKGGVGKTVLCWNIADALARRGQARAFNRLRPAM